VIGLHRQVSMKPWKYMLLAAGVAGVIGLFLPLVEVRHGPVVMGFTAFDLSFGMDKTRSLLDTQLPKFAEKRLPSNVRIARDDARLIAEASQGAALAFAPAMLMAVFAIIGFLRKRFGRILGLGAFVLGLGSIGAWIGLRYVIQYALEEAALKRTTVNLQLGAHLLLVIGGLGVLAGLGALVKPETKT
jgi:hypothetical protein